MAARSTGASGAAAEVRIDRVSKHFGGITAVGGVTLEIRRGEFFTLLGPSGSGKTTLLRMIGGFERPTSGRIYLGGEDVTNLPPNRRATSTVFQDLALFPHMTVGQNVEYGLRLRGAARAERRPKAETILRLVDLPGFHHRNVNQLSGGQRQRVALARALIVEPKVLLLDEPLSGLDEKLREQMQEELKNLHHKLVTTFVAVTHNQEEALSMSDRVAVMRDGRLEQVGTPVELYESPGTEFVADFIGSANVLRGRIQATSGVPMLHLMGLAPIRVSTDALREGEVALVIRPERVAIGTEAQSKGNIFEVEVLSTLYKGATREMSLRLPNGEKLRAQRGAKDGAEGLSIGRRTTAGWDPADAVVLPAAPRAPDVGRGGESQADQRPPG